MYIYYSSKLESENKLTYYEVSNGNFWNSRNGGKFSSEFWTIDILRVVEIELLMDGSMVAIYEVCGRNEGCAPCMNQKKLGIILVWYKALKNTNSYIIFFIIHQTQETKQKNWKT